MMYRTIFRIMSIFAVLTITHSTAFGAPPCKGPNKNDPGCPGAEEPEPVSGTPIVDSVTVDWAANKFIIRGTDLDSTTTYTLGGSALTAIGASSPAEVELLFDGTVAGEVTDEGSYSLKIDGNNAIAVYFVSSVVDPAATGCPCEADWATELGGLWGLDNTTCYELTAPGVADLAGTILTNPADASVYPQFPISASFYATEPSSSSCRLVQINDADPIQQDVVNIRINANQQTDCAAVLQTNVCATTEPSALP